MKNQLKNAAIFVGIVASLYFIFIPRKQSEKIVPEEKKRVDVAVVAKAPMRNEIITSLPSEAVNDEAKLVAYTNRLELGMNEIPSKLLGRNLNFKSRIVGTPICSLGDIDYLKGVVKSVDNPILLLSILPLQKEVDYVSHTRLALEDIINSKLLNLNVPQENKGVSRDYGVYLCLDFNRIGSCAGKQTMTVKDWNLGFSTGKIPDKIIYFQAITVRDEHIYMLPSSQWSDSDVDNYKKKLASFVQSTESFGFLQRMLKALNPLPARVNSSNFDMAIPYRNKGC